MSEERLLGDMTPRQAWGAGFSAGVSDVEADLDTLCDQLGIEHEGHPITALRAEILRLREGATK